MTILDLISHEHLPSFVNNVIWGEKRYTEILVGKHDGK